MLDPSLERESLFSARALPSLSKFNLQFKYQLEGSVGVASLGLEGYKDNDLELFGLWDFGADIERMYHHTYLSALDVAPEEHPVLLTEGST